MRRPREAVARRRHFSPRRIVCLLVLGFSIGFAAAVPGIGSAAAQQAESVPIRASTDGSAATMVFEWPAEVDYQARLDGQTLMVSFSRRLMPRFSEVFTTLADVVETVSATNGGSAVTFTLARPYQMADRKEGNRVVIDLAPPDALAQTPLPPPSPDPAPPPPTNIPAEPAQNLSAVTVRFDADDTISRASFEWSRDVGYRLERSDGRVVVRFDRPGRLVGDGGAPPRPMQGLTELQTEPGLVVALGIDDRVEVRDYRNGLTIVVDVIVPEGGLPIVADTLPDDSAALRAAPSPAPFVTPSETAAERDAQPALPFVSSGASAPSDGSESTIPVEAPDTAAIADQPPSEDRADALRRARDETREDTPTALAATQEAEAIPGPTFPEVAGAAADAPDPAPETPPGVGDIAADPALETQTAAVMDNVAEAPVIDASDPDGQISSAAEPAAEFEDGDAILVGFDVRPNGLDLRFPWDSEVAAAVFQRAGYAWVLFDSPAKFNFRLFSDDLPVVAAAEQVPMPGHALARFELSGRYRPKVRVEDGTWVISLGASGGPSNSLEVIAEPATEIGARLLVLDESAGAEISLVDPTVGDPLFIVPLGAVGHGVAPVRRMVDLEILETAQGVAVRPIADTIAVRSLRQGVEITNLAGLNIGILPDGTEVAATEGPLTPPPIATPRPSGQGVGREAEPTDSGMFSDDTRIFEFTAWRDPSGEGYLASKHALQVELGAAEPEQRAEQRLVLARFHLANVEAAETLGWIQNALADAPWLEQDPAVRSLRGAANLRLGRMAEARMDLFDPVLDFTQEIRLWRGAFLAESGDMGAANEAFTQAGDVPDDYPKAVAREFRLLAAEAAAQSGQLEHAHALLDALVDEQPDQKVQDRIDYVRGIARLAVGDVQQALIFFSDAAKSEDRHVRAKAQRERLELMLDEKLATPEQVIDGLDALRFVWRGDNFELDLMQRMAELYIVEDKFAAGLGVYRQAISIFPDSPDVRVIANIMNDTYKDLFLGDTARKLAPLEALALYYDFRELTPVGAVGDQMIFRLADRLVEVDLLDQAAAVLQHQVDFRLRGNELAKVGARLAEIYMLDKKPDVAVRALRASAVPNMPNDVAAHRDNLMVRALTAVGEYRQALDLLRGDTSPDADRLRAQIYWRQQDWLSAATASTRLLEGWVPGEFLTEAESDDLMRLAVSLAMTNNRSALAQLRDKYGDLIEETPRARAFDAISSYVDAGPLDANALTEAAEEIGSYEDFLDALREVVEADKLAAAE